MKLYKIYIIVFLTTLLYSKGNASPIDTFRVTLDSLYELGHSQQWLYDWVVRESIEIMGEGKFDRAAQLYDAAILVSLGLKNYDQAGHYIIEQSEIYNMTARTDQALKVLDRMSTWKTSDNIRMEYYIARGSLLTRSKRHAEGELALNKALELSRKTGDSSRNYVTLGSLTEVANSKGDFVAAIDYALEALRSLRSHPNKEGNDWYLINILGDLTYLFSNIGNQERAFYYARQQRKIAKALGANLSLRKSCNDMGRVHAHMGNLDSALHYIHRALVYNESTEYDRPSSSYLAKISTLHSRKGNIDSARIYLNKANEELVRDQSFETAIVASYARALYEKLTGNFSLAIDLLQKVAEDSKSSNNLMLYLTALKESARIYQEQGDERLYLRFTEKIQILEDSLFQMSQSHEIYNQENDFQEEQQRLEVEKMEARDAVRMKQIRFYLLCLLGLLAVLGTVLLLYRNNRKKSKMLADKNKQILEVLNEKDVLLKEIHHRVKNNLSIVSSLLRMQSRGLEDPSAKAALKDSENRIQSMAIIHQDLYQEDDLSGISMPEYMDNLLNNILRSFDTPHEVQVEQNIDALQLDIDTVIPMGLIINELVTNSFKYAFGSVEDPKLIISLSEQDNEIHLAVRDNGIGGDHPVYGGSTGFGSKMINALLKKLKGEIHVNVDEGYASEIIIRSYKKVA